MEGIGLTMYSDLIKEKEVTGQMLAEMVAEDANKHLSVSG